MKRKFWVKLRDPLTKEIAGYEFFPFMGDAFWHGGLAYVSSSVDVEFYAPYRVEDLRYINRYSQPKWICYTPSSHKHKHQSEAKVENFMMPMVGNLGL